MSITVDNVDHDDHVDHDVHVDHVDHVELLQLCGRDVRLSITVDHVASPEPLFTLDRAPTFLLTDDRSLVLTNNQRPRGQEICKK